MSKKNQNQSENVNLLNNAESAAEEVVTTSLEVATEVTTSDEDTHTTSESCVVDLSYRGMQRAMGEANESVKRRVVNLDSVCASWYDEMQTNEKLRAMLAKIGVEKKADFKPVTLFGRFYVGGCVCRILRGNAIAKYANDPRKVEIFAGGEPRSALRVTESGDRLFSAAKNALFSLIREGFADEVKADKALREAKRKAKKQSKKNK